MNAAHPESHKRFWGTVTALVLFIIALALFSLRIGPVDIELSSVFKTLLGVSSNMEFEDLIILDIRLPRTVLALLVGVGLGMSGAALQALVKNPLAEPGILGISSTSALGAVVVFYTGHASHFPFALALGGLAGALVSTILLLFLATRRYDTVTLILAGVAINAFAGALTALALNLSPNPFAVYEIYFWLMGSFANRSMDHVWLVLPFTVFGAAMLYASGKRLDAFAFGDEVAYTLGVNVKNTRILVITGTALAVGAGVAIAGVIGFVGLVVPHLLRPLIGNQPSRLIPISGLGGGLLTLAADMVCRVGIATGELKLGIVTAIIGAPFLLTLILRRHAVQ